MPIGHNNTCGSVDKAQSALSTLSQVRKGVAGEASAGGAQRPLDGDGGYARMDIKPSAEASLWRTQRTDLAVYSCTLSFAAGFLQFNYQGQLFVPLPRLDEFHQGLL